MKYLLIVSVIVLAACSESGPTSTNESVETSSDSTKVRVWVDPLTDCHYVYVNNGYRAGAAITLRMNREGTQVCSNA